MGLTAAVIGAAVLGTGTALYTSNQSSSQAKKLAGQQQENQNRLENEAKSRIAGQESEANAINVRDQARRRQAGLAAGAQGRQDTILTGPLGVTGEAPGGKKTLLGT